MANQEQVDRLRQGVENWNTWRDEHLFTAIDLTDANLKGTSLRGANLRQADLRGADLKGANLINSDLRGANLTDTNLRYANLTDAELNGAILKRTKIGRTIFGDIDLRTVKGIETVIHELPSIIGTDTILRSEGDIPKVFLRGAGLSDTFIEYARSLAQHPIEYYTCFISYSSQDKAFATHLYADLQNNNVRCWFAPEDMKIGDKIRPRIDETIRMFDKLLLVLSQHSIASNWVAYEVERALDKEPQGKHNVLFPIRIDDTILTCTTSWAQEIKENRHIGDFQRWKEYDAYQQAFTRLLRDLKAESNT
ncbi:MAG TPA: toll/interleukin-1 receptor domain-containing protein [Ktedonobacteraceae bacterium]|nr:toll/interleukin-1 receptor domain-containing protein [Ktedonobacteraceae bacterium]